MSKGSLAVKIVLLVLMAATLPGPARALDCKEAETLRQKALSAALPQKRLDLLLKANQACPQSWRVLDGLGRVYLEGGEYQKAKGYFLKARKADEKALPPLAGMGDVHYYQGNYAGAAGAYESVLNYLDLRPEAPGAGELQAGKNQYLQKLADCRRRLEAHEKSMNQTVGSRYIIDLLDAPAPQAPPGGGTRYLKRNSLLLAVLFEYDSARLTARSKTQLIQVVQAFNSPRLRQSPVLIIGHTDAFGDRDYNQKLSVKRAAAVRDFLISQGVAASRLTHQGRGEDVLLVPGGDKKQQAANRRVEFNLPEFSQVPLVQEQHSETAQPQDAETPLFPSELPDQANEPGKTDAKSGYFQ
jgi:outer membrane protein OmpA-like peptidoglycan-associated protein